jgi:hypothetical protein
MSITTPAAAISRMGNLRESLSGTTDPIVGLDDRVIEFAAYRYTHTGSFLDMTFEAFLRRELDRPCDLGAASLNNWR